MEIEILLDGLEPQAEELWVWGGGTLPIHTRSYATSQYPPEELVTSARCIVIQDQSVLVVGNSGGEHVLPGGGVEPGETYEEAVRRELFEETGWAVGDLTYLGFLHLKHQAPKKEGYRFPHPDFFHPIYSALAISRHIDRRIADDYEETSRFVPFDEAIELQMDSIMKSYIDAVR